MNFDTKIKQKEGGWSPFLASSQTIVFDSRTYILNISQFYIYVATRKNHWQNCNLLFCHFKDI